MVRLKYAASLALVSLLLSARIYALTISECDVTQRLTIEQVRERAKNNLSALKAGQLAKKSEAEALAATAVLLPRLSVQGSYTYNVPQVSLTLPQGIGPGGPINIINTHQLGASALLTVPLLLPAALAENRAAAHNSRAQGLHQKVVEAQVMQVAMNAFFAAIGNDELVRVRRSALELAGRINDQENTRLSSGLSTRADVSKTTVSVSRAEQALAEAVAAQSASYRYLGSLLDMQCSSAFSLIAPTVTVLSTVTESTPRARPELAEAEAKIAAAQAQRQANRLSALPSVSAIGGAAATNAQGFGQWYSAYTGVKFEWSLDVGGTLAKGRQREAAANIAVFDRRQVELDLERELQDALQLARVKKDGLQRAEAQLTANKIIFSARNAEYNAGKKTQLEFLTAQNDVTEAEVAVAQALFSLQVALVNLQYASGTLL